MKLSELQKCPGCGRSPLEGGKLLFQVVTVEPAVLDVQAARQVLGLEMYLQGHGALAEVFAPEPDAIKGGDSNLTTVMHVCIECYTTKGLAELCELEGLSEVREGK